jgi:hypothetical protein
MSSRVTRTLLRLYPRWIRDRYGDELLDLEDELRAQGEVSRKRLIRDMLVGAFVIRPTRQRTRLLTGAILVVVGLAVAGSLIAGHGTDSARHPMTRVLVAVATPVHPVPVPPIGGDACAVAAGRSCSLTACTEFIGRPSDENAVAQGSVPTIQRAQRVTGTRCPAHPHAGPQSAVVVARTAASTRPHEADPGTAEP